jgi:hypothetical protein
MLIYFGPETCRITLVEARAQNEAAYENALNALLYLIVNTSGVLQCDATRMLCLMLVGTGSISGSRKMYRQAVLETAAASAEFRRLPEILRRELVRINPLFTKLVADQEPVNEAEIAHARRTVLWRFDQIHMADREIPHQAPRGCAVTLMLLMGLAAIVSWALLHIS